MLLVASCLRFLPFRSIASLATGNALLAPCYHIVSDGSPVHVRHLYRWRNVAAFRKELDHLLRHFRPLSLEEISRRVSAGERLPERSLFLSFDDGFREMTEVVAPVCREKGVPATFFLNTAFLDNHAMGYRQKASLLIDAWQHRSEASRRTAQSLLANRLGISQGEAFDWRRMVLSVNYRQREILDECAALLEVSFADYLRSARPYLSTEQVQGLLDAGFSIGGHSIDHPKYAELTPEERIAQTRGCLDELKQRFRLPVKAFAFPFVSDGVPEPFYREVFDGGIADLIFCIGHMPEADSHRAVQRFGVESGQRYSMRELMAIQAEGRLRQKAANWKRSGFLP